MRADIEKVHKTLHVAKWLGKTNVFLGDRVTTCIFDGVSKKTSCSYSVMITMPGRLPMLSDRFLLSDLLLIEDPAF